MVFANHLCAIKNFFHYTILHWFGSEERSEPRFFLVFVAENNGGTI